MKAISALSFLPLLLAPGLGACVKDAVMDAREDPQVVVVCVLTDDPVQTLQLSFTQGASQAEAPPLTQATATLYDGEEPVGTFRHQQGNEWTLAYAAVTGHSYRLEVEVPGYDKIRAEQMMPEPAALQCFTYSQFYGYAQPWSGWSVEYDGQGNIIASGWPEDEVHPEYATYYRLFGFSHPAWLFALNYNPDTGLHEPAREICTNLPTDGRNLLGRKYVPPQKEMPNPYKYAGDDPREAETFRQARQLELYPLLAGAELHDRYLRLDETSLPQTFCVSGSFEGRYCRVQPAYFHYFPPMPGAGSDGITSASRDAWAYEGHSFTESWGYAAEPAADEGYLLCLTCSADYDRYLLEATDYQKIRESSDLTSIYLRDNIFSNISGGVGIFGAVTRRKYPWAETYFYVDAGIPIQADPLEWAPDYYPSAQK